MNKFFIFFVHKLLLLIQLKMPYTHAEKNFHSMTFRMTMFPLFLYMA